MRSSTALHFSLRNLFRSSPRLPNTGSTARDHLASERTFLAWTRTGLGFTALGIALERFSSLDPTLRVAIAADAPQKSHAELEAEKEREHLLVGALLGMGAGSIVYASVRYFSNLRLLELGVFKPAYWGAAGCSVGVAGLAGAAYVGALRERVRGRDRSEIREARNDAKSSEWIGEGKGEVKHEPRPQIARRAVKQEKGKEKESEQKHKNIQVLTDHS